MNNNIELDFTNINHEINKWEPNNDRTVEILDIPSVHVDYEVKTVKKDGSSNSYYQADVLKVYFKDKNITIEHKPHLDPYVTFNDNILCMTSDGECWVCDLNTGKENTVGMSIVAFHHDLDLSTERYENAFCISGEGCHWGCEWETIFFRYYFDKNTLECIDDDEWGEEEYYDDKVEEDE